MIDIFALSTLELKSLVSYKEVLEKTNIFQEIFGRMKKNKRVELKLNVVY